MANKEINGVVVCRGKSKDTKEWVKGFYIRVGTEAYICPGVSSAHFEDDTLHFGPFIKVDPDTVCVCTKVSDKNGKPIFSGDVLRGNDGLLGTVRYVVKYGHGGFVKEYASGTRPFFGDDETVIGNDFDNPELLQLGAKTCGRRTEWDETATF